MLLTSQVIQTLTRAADPWASAYNHSKVLASGVLFAHLGALLLGGGFAVAADRTVLRLRHNSPAVRSRYLEELHTVHRPVIVALGVLFVSGVLMALADVQTFATSLPFWIKMSLVALLLVNGGVLYKTEEGLRRAGRVTDGSPGPDGGGRSPTPETVDALWKRLRLTALASLVLWTGTVLAGTVLVNAA